MSNSNSLLRPFSFLRLFLVGLLLCTTLAVSVASRATVVKADSGEAPYGTPTQALESALSLGDSHTCVIVNSNVVCYGTNSQGQLGNGTQISSRTPVYVRNSGAANDYLSGVISVAAAADHTCALLSSGKVKCWGYGYRTGTGFFSTQILYATFVKSSFLEGDTNPHLGEHLTGAVAITSATYGGCALLSDGKVKCWGGGAGHDGEGTGYVLACKTPETTGNCSVTGGEVPLTGVKSITQAGQTSCGILTDDSLVCWGQDQGKLANPSNIATDTQLPKPAGSSTIGAKAFGTTQGAICGLYQNGATSISSAGGIVKCWGSNAAGQLGRGFTDVNTYLTAVAVTGLTNAIAISGHGGSFCALLITSEVKCWGSNPNNQFGAAVGDDKNAPTSMTFGGSPITGVAAVTLGQSHICIIMAVDGLVRCLGSNTSGQLGDGTLTTRGVPTDVAQGEVTGIDGKLTGAGADIMPPALQSKQVNTSGTKIILTYDEEMALTDLALSSRFTVTVGGVTKTIASVSADGRTVELNMVERITPGATVLMVYTDPSTGDDTNVIQDASFNDAASIPSGSVTNNSNTEAVAPTLVSAAVNAAGTSLTLTYNEALNSTTAPTGAFAVTVGGVSRSVTGAVVSGSTVVLTLASAALSGAAVTVAYTAPTSDLATTNNAIQDTAGNDAATFNSSAVSVTNGSTFDNVLPLFQNAAVSGDKTKVILTFNEVLGAVTAPTTAFVVKVNTVTRTVTGVATNGLTVELTLQTVVSPGDTVTVQYTAPAVNTATSNSAVQDLAGNDSPSIAANYPVENVTDVISPNYVSSAVNTSGSLVLTYNETLSAVAPATTDIAVTIDGVPVTVTSVSIVGATVVVVTSPVVGTGELAAYRYTDPTTSNDTNAIQDTAGNDAPSMLSPLMIPNSSNGSTVDKAAPTFVSGAVNTSGRLVLTYSEVLSATAPATASMVVTINGRVVTVSSVTIVGSTIVVVTSPEIQRGDVVTFRYTDPTTGNDTNAIQDAAGNDVASSSSAYSIPAGSNASSIDTTSPTFVSGAVNTGGSLVLTYSEALGTTAPATTSIVVTINGTSVTVVSVSIVGSTVVVVTSPVIGTGDVVTFRYTDPTSGNDSSAIEDAAGNDVASSSVAYSIPGASNRSTVDTAPPSGVTIGIDTGGAQITIRFDEDLSPTGPSASDFTVTVDGVQYTVTKSEIVDGDLVLTVSPSIKTGQAVVVSYRDPTTGDDGSALQDVNGNDIPSFGNVKTQNSSTQPSATNQADAVLDTTLPIDNETSTPMVKVDGDAPTASLSTSETQGIAGKTGKATFSDGSTFGVSKNGNLIPKLFTAYIGNVTGSVKVTYKVGKKTVSTTCSYGKYGSTKPKKVTKSVNGFFPKVFVSPKKTCLMPKAALTALNTSLVTISANLKFVRLWPTTGKAKNPESGAALRPVNRKYSVKIGTPPAS